MNVAIIYFSQTGNTRKVAQAMAEACIVAGHAAALLALKETAARDVQGYDLIGTGAPSFGSQAPVPVRAFLRSLPRLDGVRGFVFATSNEAPGRVLYDQTRLLRNRGVDVIGGFLAHGENHYPVPSVLGRFPGRPDARDLERAAAFARAVIRHVEGTCSGPMPESRPDALRPMWGLHDLLRYFQTDAWLRVLTPKPKLDRQRCNCCGWCAQECPVDNISMQQHPVIGGRCIRCYRCLTGCPQAAFGADWRLADLMCRAVYNDVCARWFGDMEPGEKTR